MVLYGKTRATLHLDLKKKSALIFNYLLKFAEDSLLDMVFYVNADGGIPDTFYSRMSRVYKEQPVIYPRGVLNRLWLSEKDKDKIREIFSVSG